jgi:hypothetical protein
VDDCGFYQIEYRLPPLGRQTQFHSHIINLCANSGNFLVEFWRGHMGKRAFLKLYVMQRVPQFKKSAYLEVTPLVRFYYNDCYDQTERHQEQRYYSMSGLWLKAHHPLSVSDPPARATIALADHVSH